MNNLKEKIKLIHLIVIIIVFLVIALLLNVLKDYINYKSVVDSHLNISYKLVECQDMVQNEFMTYEEFRNSSFGNTLSLIDSAEDKEIYLACFDNISYWYKPSFLKQLLFIDNIKQYSIKDAIDKGLITIDEFKYYLNEEVLLNNYDVEKFFFYRKIN